jgi:formylmethanofuran dehydrogenase subunit E
LQERYALSVISDFNELLERSSQIHGHLCPGQVLGVRMSMLGLSLIGITEPQGKDRKTLVVFVEMDRCASDAVQSVTGCSLGHRTMKFMDYGKMAATYMNLKTGKAVRILAREDAREKAKALFPGINDKYQAQTEAYKIMKDGELFDVMEVMAELRPEDMPGRPLRRVKCDICNEYVQDCRDTAVNGKTLCRACATGSYYKPVAPADKADFILNSEMQKSHNGLQIRSKIWIGMDEEPVFGKGRMKLLEAIGSTGSITKAAQAVNISYRRAWSYIKAMEERLGIRLVECRKGGKSGGGASLTEAAREFMGKYEQLEAGVRELVDRKFYETFGR